MFRASGGNICWNNVNYEDFTFKFCLIRERLTVHSADPRLRPDNNHYNHNNVPRTAIVRTTARANCPNGRRIVAVADQINVTTVCHKRMLASLIITCTSTSYSPDAKQFNCAFCDTSMTFCTHLLWPIRSYFKMGPQPDLACGGGGSHFKNGWHEFAMPHISANNIDRKLIIVSMPMFSGSKNPNVAIIWVCAGCGSHFQNGRHEFSMSHISGNNIDRKFILVSLSLLSESQNQNMVNILVCGVCGSHFQNGRHEFSMSHISANNIDRKLIIVSMSMFSESMNPNVAIKLICGGCGSHFQNGRHEFSMSEISQRII